MRGLTLKPKPPGVGGFAAALSPRRRLPSGLAIARHSERREDRHHHGGPKSAHQPSTPKDAVLARSRAAVTTWLTGLTFDEALQPAGHRIDGHEDVGQERQREQDQEARCPARRARDLAVTPMSAKIHDSAHATRITSSTAAAHTAKAARRPVADQRTRSRRSAPTRSRYRTTSPSSAPASGAMRAIGNDLKRSKTPLSMSSRSVVPATAVAVSTSAPGCRG